MSMFNQHSRTRNVLTSSIVGASCNLISALLGFVYRSVFLHILSASYLGINGLFSNILQVLSITDLGIATAISYRFYDPISKNDVRKVGQLLTFYKRIYLLIASVIFLLGMSLYPFLEFFIKDTSELPPDVNIRLIYVLYLIQTLSGYLFSYRQTILSADQKHYLLSLSSTAMTLARYLFQILFLWIWRDFTLTMVINILITVVWNFVFSLWVSSRYKEVFLVKEILPKEERKQIYRDTKATMLHRIGGTVLGATDNIVLSKYVGLAITGLYSNYALIVSSVTGITVQLLSGFASSIGSAHVQLSKDSSYEVYRRLLFADFWISGMITSCLFFLIDSFICLWVGEQMLIDISIVAVICIQVYLQLCRLISTTYTNACGLFVKDQFRPLVESTLNLVISIILTIRIGIAGVFWGTIISCLLTVFWREPYILHRYEFNRRTSEYWKLYIRFGMLTLAVNWALYDLQSRFMINNTPLTWILRGVLCAAVYNAAAVAVFCRSREFLFYRDMLRSKLARFF